MEFVLHPTLPSQIILAPRVAPGVGGLTSQDQAQQVLVAIVKGTFMRDDPTAAPLPEEQQTPLLLQDIFFNHVRNGDFSAGVQMDADGVVITPVAAWQAEGPAIEQVMGPPDYMRVTGPGSVTQNIVFKRALGGRTFRLRFQARADAAVAVSGIRVESASGVTLLSMSRTFNPGVFGPHFSAAATWPADLEDTEATVVLRGADSTAVEYDRVQLTEGAAVQAFDPNDPIRYEHDLASFKPRTDVIVLGAPAPPEPGPSVPWTETVEMNGESMSGNFTGGTRFTFGWQNRLNGIRNGYTGDAGSFDPEEMLLPVSFNNKFFNGGRYNGGTQPDFSHPPAGATAAVKTKADYASPPLTRTRTHLLHLPAQPPRAMIAYRTRDAREAPVVEAPLAMNVDTIVYDKASGQFYAVWRGVWDYASVPAERYVRLALS